MAAALADPFVATVPTVITIVGALLAGSVVSALLLRAAEMPVAEPEEEPAQAGAPGSAASPVVRSRETGSGGGISVGRGGFLLLGGGAAVAGLVAAGVGRFLLGGAAQGAAKPKKLNLPETPAREKPGREGRAGRGRREDRQARDAAQPPGGCLHRRARDA